MATVDIRGFEVYIDGWPIELLEGLVDEYANEIDKMKYSLEIVKDILKDRRRERALELREKRFRINEQIKELTP